ncbi:MAG: hypothetical protein Q9174_004996 [Haloplaca sp. 1 TL-2023]
MYACSSKKISENVSINTDAAEKPIGASRFGSHLIPGQRFTTTAKRKEEPYAQRYGSATEPSLPPPPVPSDLGRNKSLAGAFEKEVKSPAPKQDEKKAEQVPSKETAKPKEEHEPPESPAISAKPSIGGKVQGPEPSESDPIETLNTAQEAAGKSLDTVLNRQTSSQTEVEESKPPHLQAPPYVHHFDTFSLVRDLKGGGFTQDQSVTLMKAVRGLLAANLELARDSLVSKSNVENETYLFRAACSELRTEILNTRRTSQQRTSTQLSHLRHEVDILSQRLTQESAALKEDLRGMLNDRKMSVRIEEQTSDQAIQELNYKIATKLTSEAKTYGSDLRSYLIQKAAMGIGFTICEYLSWKRCLPSYIRKASVATVLVVVNLYLYSSYHARREKEQKAAAEKSKRDATSSSGSGGQFTVPSREMGTQTGADTEAMLANVSEDGSPAYVSLG